MKRVKTVLLWAMVTLIFAGSMFSKIRSEDERRLVEGPATPPRNPVVAVVRGEDYRKTVKEAIKAAGGFKFKRGARVVIKVNVVSAKPSGVGNITDYRVAMAVAEMAKSAGAGKVYIVEGSVGDTFTCFRAAGYVEEAQKRRVELVDLNKEPVYWVRLQNGLTGKEFPIPRIYFDADYIISVPEMKTHYTAGVTLSLKNVIGVPPYPLLQNYARGKRSDLHAWGINKCIVDLNCIRKPDFAVIDGMVAGEGNGPTNPIPKKMNLIIASKDPVAADATATRIMGIDPYEITHLVYADRQNLGVMDESLIKIAGLPVNNVKSVFLRAEPRSIPYIKTTVASGAKAPVMMDGKLDEWADAMENRLDRQEQVTANRKNWAGIRDNSGKFKIMLDQENFYLAVQVTDNRKIRNMYTEKNRDQITFGDGVELFLSLNNPFETPEENTIFTRRKSGENDLRIFVPYNDKKTNVYRIGKESAAVLENAEVVLENTGDGYDIEMKIPLSLLAAQKWTNNEEFWVDLAIIDVDQGPGTVDNIIAWSGQGNQAENPYELGRALIRTVP